MSETNAAPTQQATPQATEPVIIHGGDSPASWDELEALTSKPEPKAKKEAKEPKEKKEASDVPDEKAEEKLEVKGEKTKVDDKVAKTTQPVKIVKLKSGESVLDVSSDTLVPVKVDGKSLQVPIQEMINRYSQKEHVDQLYKTMKTEKQSFESERAKIAEALNKSYDYLVNQKDLRGFMEFLGEAMGVDAESLYSDAVGDIRKQMEEYTSLSPEERKLRELEQENAYYKKRTEAQKQAKEQAKQRQSLEAQVSQALEQSQMTKGDLVKAWDDLIGLGYKSDELSVEFLTNYHSNSKKIGFIEEKLKEYAPEHASNQEIIEDLATQALKLDASLEDIEEIVKQLYSETAEKKLTKKINTNMKAAKQGGSKAIKNPGSDPLFFDDI
jgi:hypothetical protein